MSNIRVGLMAASSNTDRRACALPYLVRLALVPAARLVLVCRAEVAAISSAWLRRPLVAGAAGAAMATLPASGGEVLAAAPGCCLVDLLTFAPLRVCITFGAAPGLVTARAVTPANCETTARPLRLVGRCSRLRKRPACRSPHGAWLWRTPMEHAACSMGVLHVCSPWSAARCAPNHGEKSPTPAPGRRLWGWGGLRPLPYGTRLDAAPLQGFTLVGSAGRSTSSRATPSLPPGGPGRPALWSIHPARVTSSGRRPPSPMTSAKASALRGTLNGSSSAWVVASPQRRRARLQGSPPPRLGGGEALPARAGSPSAGATTTRLGRARGCVLAWPVGGRQDWARATPPWGRLHPHPAWAGCPSRLPAWGAVRVTFPLGAGRLLGASPLNGAARALPSAATGGPCLVPSFSAGGA